MQTLCVEFRRDNGAGGGEVNAFITIHCSTLGCSGKVAFSRVYMGQFMLAGSYHPYNGHPLDSSSNGGTGNRFLLPQGHCPECGVVFQITHAVVSEVISQATAWANQNNPYPSAAKTLATG